MKVKYGLGMVWGMIGCGVGGLVWGVKGVMGNGMGVGGVGGWDWG